MQTDIHPKYFNSMEIRCSCGNVIICGSTKEKLKTELCSKCHPFYTGQQKLIDTAGRVDKFEAKRKKAVTMKAEVKRRAEQKKKKPEEYKEKEIPQEVIEKAMGISPKPNKKWGQALGEAPAQEVIKEEIVEAKKAKKVAPKKVAAKKKAVAKKSIAKAKTSSKKPVVKKKNVKK